MAYKKNKPVINDSVPTEEVTKNVEKKPSSLKNELVSLYKELDSINLEEQNLKIENLMKQLQKIIEEYDSFLKEDNSQELTYAETKVCEGKMIVKRYAEEKPIVVKESDCSLPYKFGFKDLVIFILIISCIVLGTTVAILANV